MQEKSTQELQEILGRTHPKDVDNFLTENEENLYTGDKEFTIYMRQTFKKHKTKQNHAFFLADIDEANGYKLISQEIKTRKRDVILRLCYAGDFTFEETQKALRLYKLPELYAKYPRDAILISVFSNPKTNIEDVNELLVNSGHEEMAKYGS